MRNHRRRLGLSQEELATRARISVRALRKIETHETSTPRPATVRLLADAFGLADAERERFCQLALGSMVRIDAAPLAPATGPPSIARLLGRDPQLATLCKHADAAAAGAFHVVWASGGPGMGKTALTTEFAGILEPEGWVTALSAAPAFDTAPPGWAWIDLLGRLIDAALPGEVADRQLIQRTRALLQRAQDEGAAGLTPFQLARTVTGVLSRCSDARPLLVGLDDGHLADRQTLQILRYAFTELADRPVLVVVAVDPTVLSPAVDTARATFAGPRVAHLALDGLEKLDVAKLLDRCGAAPLAAELVAWIAERTGGNPQLVEEVAQAIATEGPGVAPAELARWIGLMIHRRLASLPARTQNLLRAIAGLGSEVSLDVLLSLEPAAADTALTSLEAAIRVGLLTQTAAGTVRFADEAVRVELEKQLSGAQQVRLHAQVLVGLERARAGASALGRPAPGVPLSARTAAERATHAIDQHLRALESVILAALRPAGLTPVACVTGYTQGSLGDPGFR